MSLTTDVPKGLRNRDAERGAAYWAELSPMRFIPKVDPVQDSLKKSPMSVKIVNPMTKNLQNVKTWSGGTREQFLLHVNKSISTITQLNFFVNYQKALDICKEKKAEIKQAKTVAATLVLAKGKAEAEKKLTHLRLEASTL